MSVEGNTELKLLSMCVFISVLFCWVMSLRLFTVLPTSMPLFEFPNPGSTRVARKMVKMCWLGPSHIPPDLGFGLLANLFSFSVDFLKTAICNWLPPPQYTWLLRIALRDDDSLANVSRGYVMFSLHFSNLDFLLSCQTFITKCNLPFALHLRNQLFLFFCSCPGSDVC